jgi:hypothetical protein
MISDSKLWYFDSHWKAFLLICMNLLIIYIFLEHAEPVKKTDNRRGISGDFG